MSIPSINVTIMNDTQCGHCNKSVVTPVSFGGCGCKTPVLPKCFNNDPCGNGMPTVPGCYSFTDSVLYNAANIPFFGINTNDPLTKIILTQFAQIKTLIDRVTVLETNIAALEIRVTALENP